MNQRKRKRTKREREREKIHGLSASLFSPKFFVVSSGWPWCYGRRRRVVGRTITSRSGLVSDLETIVRPRIDMAGKFACRPPQKCVFWNCAFGYVLSWLFLKIVFLHIYPCNSVIHLIMYLLFNKNTYPKKLNLFYSLHIKNWMDT